MGMHHYFGKNPEKRAKFIFNFIAPVYGYLDKTVAEGFDISIKKLVTNIDIKNKKVLDVGTGTGAWGSLFLKNGAQSVTGVDFSEKMLKQAKKTHPDMDFIIGDAKNLKQIPDNSFDIATASYVLHGTKRNIRALILAEMKRVATECVIIHDFMGKTHFSIQILEWLERSDYHNFKNTFTDEMKEFFDKTLFFDVGKGSGIYIGKLK